MKNLITIMFILFACILTSLVFFGCENDDKDKTPVEEATVCEPACTDSQECKCAETDGKKECKCEDKVVVPEEIPAVDPCKDKKESESCGENKVCDKDLKCVDKVPTVEEPECSEAKPCADDKVCKEGKCEAKPEEPAKPESKCDPVCDENKECSCEADKCECKDKSPEEPKADTPTEEPKPEENK